MSLRNLHVERRARVALAALGSLVVAMLAVWTGLSWYESRLPGTYGVMEFGAVDLGGGPPAAHGAHGVSVASLRGPSGEPDVRRTIVARTAEVELASGRSVNALTFDGTIPGPELRVRRGDLVEVTLVNRNVEDGVSIHWHGVDVPNAEDGVAGVTQDAVLPGRRHTYRFRATQLGTFWYHSHQSSGEQVRRGLYGAFVIEPPRRARVRGVDSTVMAHTFGGALVLNASDTVAQRAVAPGTPVRLRLVNTDNVPRRFSLGGTSFRVVAVDGTELHGATPIRNRTLALAAGGRYDLAFRMPATAVRLDAVGAESGIAFSRDGSVIPAPPAVEREPFDPARYGTPARAPFGPSTRFDRAFAVTVGKKLGFVDGRFGFQWSINGKLYPDVPMPVIRRGELVKVTFENESGAVHPMHLHGHHLLVLSRDGVPVRGSPWWVDTLDVHEGERYEVAFRAGNAGIWMLHCHNLEHAAEGLTMHFAYDGVHTPFKIGGDAGNDPE